MSHITTWIQRERLCGLETVFKITYLVHLLLSFTPYAADTPLTAVTLLTTMATGGVLLLYRGWRWRAYARTPALPLLLLFLVSFAVPSLFFYRYALTDSLKTLVWMTFQFCLLFAFNARRPAADVRKELTVVGGVITAVITLENAVSLGMAFTGYFEAYLQTDGTYAVTGLAWWGRLYGVHGDPNYACLYSIAALLFCGYLCVRTVRRWMRITAAAAAAVHFLFVSFTASRTGLICMTLGAVVFTFCLYAGRRRALMLTAAVCVAVLLLNAGAVSGFNAYSRLMAQSQAGEDGAQTQDEHDAIGRTEEELQGDPTNRRLDIWGSGMEIFRDNAVAGIGFENVLGYARDRLPHTYIINNDLADFDAFHNVVMDILVSQGVVGVLLAAVFAVWFAVSVGRRMGRHYAARRAELALCLGVTVSMLASALFLSHIFYVNIATTGIFWLFAGYLAHFATAEA